MTGSTLPEGVREALADAIWDALDDHGHNGIDCRPEKPMDYTAAHAADAIAPIVAREIAAAEQRVRERVEALADEFESEVDWSSGRNGYTDNWAWENAARRLRAALAADTGGEPIDLSPGAFIDTGGES